MSKDSRGFFYPMLKGECITCGLCERVCPFHDSFSINKRVAPTAFAVLHRDNNIRLQSSSGGAFTAISDCILSRGGVVYGAGFDSDFQVCHKRATAPEERDRFRGSKYVQSNINSIFSRVQEDLKSGLLVLFTGTPCQTAGLHSFLATTGTNVDGLFLCDLICHGVPSPLVWEEYVNFIKKSYGHEDIVDISFRDKRFGWKSYTMSIKMDMTEYVAKDMEDPFLNIFNRDYALRPSCTNCTFKKLDRMSDITIGDYHGVERHYPELDDGKGVSLVLVNSEKGMNLFWGASKYLIIKPIPIEQCMQRNLQSHTLYTPRRQEEFWHDYFARGFNYVLKKYTEYGVIGKIKGRTRRYAKKILVSLGVYRFFRT